MSSQLLDVPTSTPPPSGPSPINTLTLVREAVLTAGYGPLTTLAEKAVVSVLRNISVGRLRIVTSKYTYEFPERSADGDREEEPHAELKVINDAFWVRLCMMGDLGFAEAYMFGDVLCEDLNSTFLRLTSFRFLNSLGNARSNISAHYDLSDDMFKAFLSEDMTYSCAIFSDLDEDLRETPLLVFSNDKLRQLLTPSPPSEITSADSNTSTSHTPSTRPTPPLADTLVAAHSANSRTSFHVHASSQGTAFSRSGLGGVQPTCACARGGGTPGLRNRIRVHLLDYREMPREWDGSFDRVVSIEMVEAVGLENVDAYWAAIDRV
ncbi:hypothetical protein F5888DRAFT_1808958 [Russula emetica]|nr:hypothetical protein F5888DRAFT_1808958 [Russula emetica]